MTVIRACGDVVIRHTSPLDLLYIKHLSKQESYALGWIPEQIYERVWKQTFTGWILMAEVNKQPVGFVFAAPGAHKPFFGRIYQLAVQRDARRFEYGTILAYEAHDLIKASNSAATVLRCAEDLPANGFWESIGWHLDTIIKAGSSVGDSPRIVRRNLHKRIRYCQEGLFAGMEVKNRVMIP